MTIYLCFQSTDQGCRSRPRGPRLRCRPTEVAFFTSTRFWKTALRAFSVSSPSTTADELPQPAAAAQRPSATTRRRHLDRGTNTRIEPFLSGAAMIVSARQWTVPQSQPPARPQGSRALSPSRASARASSLGCTRPEIDHRPGVGSTALVPRRAWPGKCAGRSSDCRAGVSGLLIGPAVTGGTNNGNKRGEHLETLDHSGGAVPDSHRIPCSPVTAGCRAGHQHTRTNLHNKGSHKPRQVRAGPDG
jgi:hypothetical protein